MLTFLGLVKEKKTIYDGYNADTFEWEVKQ